MGARKTVTTESTGRGARAMAANNVSRLMPQVVKVLQIPGLSKKSFFTNRCFA